MCCPKEPVEEVESEPSMTDIQDEPSDQDSGPDESAAEYIPDQSKGFSIYCCEIKDLKFKLK